MKPLYGSSDSRDMLGDCFAKVKEPTQLMSALESGFLRHKIKHWIIRDV
jgi:hypothetical protein